MMIETARTARDQAAATDGASSGINAPLLIALGALALTALLYWPTSLEIADLWQDTVRRRYTHGWVVLAVTVWLIWRDRANLRSIGLSPPIGGWLLAAVGSIGWLVGYNAGLLAMTTLSLPLLVLATIWAAGGLQLARRVAFPVLFLYFALPFWELLNPPLQSMTAFVNLWLTGLVGIPVLMDEYTIHIPAGWFDIAGGCSGLHFLIVALAIAAVHGHIDTDDCRSRGLLVGLAAALAIATNWIRVFIIIVAGHLTDMQHFLVKIDHYYFGWLLFTFALVFYVYVSSHLRRDGQIERLPVVQATVPPQKQRAAAMTFSAIALAVGPVWLLALVSAAPEHGRLAAPTLRGWSGPDAYQSDWSPVFDNPDDEFQVAYGSASSGEVAVYFAAYHSQRQGKELHGHGNSIVGGTYKLKESLDRPVVAGIVAPPVSEYLAVSDDGRILLIWSMFAVDGRPDPFRLGGQLVYGIRSLIRTPTVSVAAFAAECPNDCMRAREALEAMYAVLVPALLQSIENEKLETQEISQKPFTID